MLVPPDIVAVTYLLSLGSQQFQTPIIVTMTIAATRMHRSLVDFATSNVCVILHILFVWLIMTNIVLARTRISK